MPKPGKGPGPAMGRGGGVSMPRSMGGGGPFGSPSQHPKRFANQIGNHFSNLVGQMGNGPTVGGVYHPGLGPGGGGGGGGGGKKRRRNRPGSVPGVDPNTTPDTGTQSFGTYATDIDASQFQNENFKGKGLKGNKKLDPFGGMFGGMGSMMGGGMGGGMGGFGPMGGMGYGGMGMGGGFDILGMLMSLLGQFGNNSNGPISGM